MDFAQDDLQRTSAVKARCVVKPSLPAPALQQRRAVQENHDIAILRRRAHRDEPPCERAERGMRDLPD
jgi:hypothetical protein